MKQVRLLRPGHAPSDIFSRDLLARISWFSTLRLIAFLGPGNSQVTANTDREWSDRGLPGYSVQTVDAPAWEYVTLLANAAKKDLWIGIPYYASDDYITKLAQLFKYGSDGVNPYTSPRQAPSTLRSPPTGRSTSSSRTRSGTTSTRPPPRTSPTPRPR